MIDIFFCFDSILIYQGIMQNHCHSSNCKKTQSASSTSTNIVVKFKKIHELFWMNKKTWSIDSLQTAYISIIF